MVTEPRNNVSCLFVFLGHTHSLGRVRYDRSVQYKYLNPHLVAIATQTTGQSKRKYTWK